MAARLGDLCDLGVDVPDGVDVLGLLALAGGGVRAQASGRVLVRAQVVQAQPELLHLRHLLRAQLPQRLQRLRRACFSLPFARLMNISQLSWCSLATVSLCKHAALHLCMHCSYVRPQS